MRKIKSKKEIHKRFLCKIKKDENGCWNWLGRLSFGYGNFCLNSKKYRVHRYSYEYYVSKIPDGLVIDHLCRNRKCVNPKHLECVTQKENVLRGISIPAINAKKRKCKYGHLLDKNNVYIVKKLRNGIELKFRNCKICKRKITNLWKKKRLNDIDYIEKRKLETKTYREKYHKIIRKKAKERYYQLKNKIK